MAAVLVGLACFTAGYQSKASSERPDPETRAVKEVSEMDLYEQMADELNAIQVVDSKDLTAEMLETRHEDGTIIIEKVIGRVLNSELDGIVLNDLEHCYISYRDVKGAQKGNIILTYLIYNPDSVYTDDVLARFDYIIDSSTY